jgi:NAD(P)-dependent dehydrogenase (short-subunit alcohol dehydrogenase family)
MDVTDAKAVAYAKELVSRSVGQAGLAGLVNNAGVGFSLPLEFVPLDALRGLFEVNVLGMVGVTQAFLPLVRQARGRIVNVSSLASIAVAPFHGPYSASKLAVNGFSRALRMEMKPFGVQVSVVMPGTIDTPIWQKGAEWSEQFMRSQSPLLNQLYGKAFGRLRQYFMDMGRRGIPPEMVARAIAHALTAKRAKHYYLIGREAQLFSLLVSIVPERFHDWVTLRTIGIED